MFRRGFQQTFTRSHQLVWRRSFASDVKVELPVRLYGLEARYANALFVAATKAGNLPAVEKDLTTILDWTKTSSAFSSYIHNPVISRADKIADMAKVSKGMNDITQGFLNVLAANGRLGDLEGVLGQFATLIRAQRKIVEATVVSADELTKKQKKAVEAAISAGYLEKGESLSLELKVDPALIGGLQIQIGDRFLNLSTASLISDASKYLV